MLERIISKNTHWGVSVKRDQGAIVLVFGSQGVREVAGTTTADPTRGIASTACHATTAGGC